MNHPAEAERGVMTCRCRSTRCSRLRSAPPPGATPRSTSCASASCGRGSATSPPTTRRRGSATPRRAEEIRTPSAQNRMVGLPVPQVHELEQRRRHGGGDHHVLGRGGRALGVARGPVGVPARPAPTATSTRSSATAGRSPARPPSSSAASGRSSWPAPTSTTSPSSTSTRASRRRCSSAPRPSGCRLDRQLTRTGGLPFAGGPWNNYVMHAIATMVERPARSSPASRVSCGPTAGTPPSTRSACTPPSRPPAGSATPTRRTRSTPCRGASWPTGEDAAGPATIEAYTVMHAREARPSRPSPRACSPTAGGRGGCRPTTM